MSDKNVFIGTGRDDDFCVFSSDCYWGDIEIGDTITGDFLGDAADATWGKNLTQDRDVYLFYEDWECSYKSAMKTLRTLSNPTRIFT